MQLVLEIERLVLVLPVAVGLGVSLVVDHHDDLVRVREPRLDVALVRGGNRDWRDDHLHVRRLRKEAQRSAAPRRRVEGVGALIPFYLSASLRPAFRLSQFRMALKTRK